MGFFDDMMHLFGGKDPHDDFDNNQGSNDNEEIEVTIDDDKDNDFNAESANQQEDNSVDLNSYKKKGNKFPDFLKGLPIGILLVVVIGLYLSTGFYKVGPTEVGVVTRFGKYNRQVESGLHYHLPYPFESVYTPKVTKVRRTELGFRTIDPGPPARYQNVNNESLMLTGDLAIVSANAVVKYKIKDPSKYLFSIKNPDETVRDASEAALRQIIGQNQSTDILTNKKAEIQLEAKELLQEILDSYYSGIHIDNFLFQDVSVPVEVQQAYRDVASAKEDKHKKVNQAQAYRNQIIPEAKGQASAIINEAEAYQAERIADAEGDVARFNELLIKYQTGKEVTRTRLYLETMEEILPGIEKIMVGDESQGVLKLLNLNNTEKGVEK